MHLVGMFISIGLFADLTIEAKLGQASSLHGIANGLAVKGTKRVVAKLKSVWYHVFASLTATHAVPASALGILAR